MNRVLQKGYYKKTYYILLQPNILLREIFIHTSEEKIPTKWIKQVKKYMIELHLTLHTIEYSKHQHIRRMIK